MIAALVVGTGMLALPPAPIAVHRTADGCRFAALAGDERTLADEITRKLRDAEERSAKAPAAGIADLRAALADAHEHAFVIAKSDAAREAHRYARLALVRSLLATGANDEATAAMDALLASAGAEPLPARLFGPGVVELHDARKQALANGEHGELVVECGLECYAVVDDTLLGCAAAARPLQVSLPTGEWTVTVVSSTDATHRQIADVALAASHGATVKLAAPADRVAPPRADRRTRLLPRWAGILGMAVGAGAMIAGGVLLGVDGKCPDLKTDPMGSNPCSRRLNTDVPGIVLLAGGGAIVTGFAIAFGIGEARQAKAKRAR